MVAEPHNATLCCDRIGLAAIWQLTDRGAPLGRTVYRSGSRDYGGRASARRSLSLPDRIGLAADWLQRLIAPLYQTASVRQLTGGRASALCVPRPHRSAAACVGRALACRSAVTASVWQQTGGRASARRSDETASVLQLTGARASARPLPAPPTRAPTQPASICQLTGGRACRCVLCPPGAFRGVPVSFCLTCCIQWLDAF